MELVCNVSEAVSVSIIKFLCHIIRPIDREDSLHTRILPQPLHYLQFIIISLSFIIINVFQMKILHFNVNYALYLDFHILV
jgi:hypothetical protein